MKMQTTFAGKNVSILGLGRSAAGASRLLLSLGAKPFVSDAGENGAMAAWREQLSAMGVDYEVGGHTARAFEGCDVLVMSPGVPPGAPALAEALVRGVPMISEIELAFLHTRSKVIAVTGTNGKTTTTELIAAMIAGCGATVSLSGNNACPFSQAVVEHPDAAFAVVEVSSYQLETCVSFRPWMACVLNLSPDHLGRHGDMAGYAAVKAKIFARQGEGDVAVVNLDDSYMPSYPMPAGVRRMQFSTQHEVADGLWSDGYGIFEGRARVAKVSDVPIPGKHNLSNALAALTMMLAGGFDWESTLRGLRAFRAVEHRIEFTAEIGGAKYYNDSKSTNIDSLRVALESFNEPIVLIVGGRGKGSDYSTLAPLVRARTKHIVTMGEDAPLLEAAFSALRPTVRAANMGDAVLRARSVAVAGDVVLLSPGCASFDMYNNFEERGRDFKACVLAAAANSRETAA